MLLLLIQLMVFLQTIIPTPVPVTPTPTGSANGFGLQEWAFLVAAIGTALTSLIKSIRDGAELQKQVNELRIEIGEIKSENVRLRIEAGQKSVQIEGKDELIEALREENRVLHNLLIEHGILVEGGDVDRIKRRPNRGRQKAVNRNDDS